MKKAMKRALCLVLCLCFLCGSISGLSVGTSAVGKNEAQIADFLVKQMGFNSAAVSGILANIEWESGFNPDCYGDKINGVYTSYGICQWHNTRWDRLKQFCQSKGYDWKTLEGQLWYLKYELEEYYPTILSYIKNVANTADGAYDAGYYWCYNFERPADTANMSVKRGNLAKSKYWPVYSNSYSTVSTGVYRLKNKATGTYMCVKDGGDSNGQNIELTATAGSNTVFIMDHVYGTVYNLRAECSKSGRMLNVYATSVVSGKNVTLYDRTDDNSQQWFFENVSGGYVVRSAENASCVLDVSGTNVCVMTYTGASSQVWELVNISTYTVTYNANGGTGAPAAQTKKHGASLKLSTSVPKRSGYIFMGWATKADAASAEYAAGATLTYDGNLTLYAVWQIEPCEGEGGTGHKWSLTEYTAPPTCTENGKGNYYCSKCKKTQELTLFDADTVTDWLTEPLEGIPQEFCGTKTQFRYADGGSETELVPVGVGTTLFAEFPAGFDKNSELYKTYNNEIKDTETGTSVRIYSDTYTVAGYIYWHWCSSSYSNITTPSNLYINTEYTDGSDGTRAYDIFHAFFSEQYEAYDPGKDATKFVNAAACQSVYWWQAPITVYSAKYADYEKATVPTFGEWQDAPLADADGKITETRTLYKYDLSAPGHDYIPAVTAPTCTEDGYTVNTCRRCSDTYTDSIVSAPGHSFSVDVTPPTCTEDGYSVYTCTVCGYTYTGDPVPTQGHSYVAETVAPTCTENGYTVHICSACGDSYRDSETPATGHSMYLSEITAPPTCTENATGKYSCKNCDESYEAVIGDSETDTGWLEEPLSAVSPDFAETKTQYRYAYMGDTGEYVEKGQGTTLFAQFPAGFDTNNLFYKRYNITVADTETRKYSSEKAVYGYIYWHWCSSQYTCTEPSNLLISREYSSGSNGGRPYDVFHAFYSAKYVAYDTSKDATKFVNAAACPHVYWWQEPITLYSVQYTDYEKVTSPTHTEWQDSPLPDSEEMTVETRTLYRYDLSAHGHKYVSGKCSVCGEEDPNYILPGDINFDKKVNAVDGNLIKQLIVKGGYTEKELSAADINLDNKLNAVDSNLLRKVILGKN
ncbi:MAG: phage tail tip lysozyme [Clostridia bacterium]|nr:phage tail tip lysozyme [Clostridia bacterium]